MMSNDPSPLNHMGTQSQETVALAAAQALAAVRATARASDGLDLVDDEAEDAGSTVGEAARWAVGKGKDALGAVARQVRSRSAARVAAYTREDPLRAVLIAAGAGALLMMVAAGMARSGVRSARRRLR
jgi:ElaB/YqjD/DUF883 family membrane-anchored ribosome-binding protein